MVINTCQKALCVRQGPMCPIQYFSNLLHLDYLKDMSFLESNEVCMRFESSDLMVESKFLYILTSFSMISCLKSFMVNILMYFIEVAYLILLRTFPLQFVPSQIFSFFFAGCPYPVIDLPTSFSTVTVEKERSFALPIDTL